MTRGNEKGGYLGTLSHCTNLEAELVNIRKGLRRLKDLRLSNIVVETDSEVSIKLIEDRNLNRHLKALIFYCCLFFDVCNGKIVYTKRKGTNVRTL